MSRLDKAKERLKSVPRDYTYSEAKSLLRQLGFEESNKGITSAIKNMNNAVVETDYQTICNATNFQLSGLF